MTILTLPAAFVPSTCSLTMSVRQSVSASQFGGSEEAIDLLNDRWLLSCDLPARALRKAGWLEAFIGSFRGQVNLVPLWHFARPQPMGTYRGTLTLAASAAQGAGVIVIQGGTAFGTLKAGDMLGVGGLLLMVQSDCTANESGVITVPVTNRLRAAQGSGAAVTWDKPTALFRLLDNSGVAFIPGFATPSSFDFGEKP